MEETCLGSAGGRTFSVERKRQSAGGGGSHYDIVFISLLHCSKTSIQSKFHSNTTIRLSGL